ncbi:MAG: ankyrin repeat domain-containing protein, partial [Pyramidobacter sp.]|nr:ankyrin repeat domain-containing protein [Pyramidobacter sp.]
TTPMMIACQYSSDVQTVKELYAAGAEVMRPRRGRDLPLHFAARNDTGSAPQIIRFLLDSRAEVDCRNGGGWTPLMTAAQFSSHPETLKALLDAGAQVNARKNDGMNAVMVAVSNASPQANAIVKMLIDAGADLETTDGRGRTAFEVAARSGRSLETLRLVAQHETASSLRIQNARLAAAPAAANVTRYVRVMNAPDKRSKAAIPYHETRPGALLGNKLRALHLLPPLENSDNNACSASTQEDTLTKGVFVARFRKLLRSYNFPLPQRSPLKSSKSKSNIILKNSIATTAQDKRIVVPSIPQPLPAQAPKPGVPVKPAAPAPVQPLTPEEEFPAETFSVTELLSAHPVSETDAKLARQLDETVNEAARAKDERREDEVYPL